MELIDDERLLTHGTVNSIMNNEKVVDPVIQILAIQKLTTERKGDKYSLKISDGQNFNSIVLLSRKLNGMIYSGEITEFAILKLKAYKFSIMILDGDRVQVLIISDLCILRYGYYVGYKIGNPTLCTNYFVKIVGDGTKTLDSATGRNHSTTIKYEELLTKGALFSIMKNEEVKDAVVQVLDIKKIYDYGAVQRYRLLISDGQNLSSFALLGRSINNIIYSGELTQFTIFQVKRYMHVMIAVGYRPIMFITDLNILINGHRVGSKIGDPIVIINNAFKNDIVSFSQTVINETYFDYPEICRDSDKLFMVEYEQMLIAGSLESIFNNETVESCIQVIDIERINNCWDKEIFRLHLSDSYVSCSLVVLASNLNDMVITGILNKFSFIWITKHIMTEISISDNETSINSMIIKELRVLIPGEQVGLKIGDPKPFISPENDTEEFINVLANSVHVLLL